MSADAHPQRRRSGRFTLAAGVLLLAGGIVLLVLDPGPTEAAFMLIGAGITLNGVSTVALPGESERHAVVRTGLTACALLLFACAVVFSLYALLR
ncbi:hypothetical protein [Prauserella cavernicola]|uniref:Uncharacterized protein n=1 Tax=Prauserella cavernicola TaxID=2800127 RepID=A0A934QY86_9PSEU|nr:hypothetical protein [Prauserella cavernicola]MBK1788748.1 hypothetical protein [Prauserella cavernicola]